jgi:peptidoglycan DL-endopeptidase CwlO
VSSHRLKRTVRGALAAGAVIVAVGVTSGPASAAPPTPPPGGDPMQQYQQLGRQVDALNEQINNAKVDLANKQAQAQKASADIAAAKQAAQDAQAKEEQYRTDVDKLTDATFEGARFNQVSALLTGTSARDYLDRATDLAAIASDNARVLGGYRAAVNAATAAEQRAEQDQRTAQQAADAANALLGQLNTQKAQLATQITQVNAALHQLTRAQVASLATDTGPAGAYLAPSGIAGQAMQFALNQRGKPYLFGGSGPGAFDCSGLIDFVYAQAGMPGLPHSAAALQRMGVAVPQSAIQPGDLVFFGRPAYHVGIYVGGGMMVSAPTTGQVVKVEPLFSGYSGARRLG